VPAATFRDGDAILAVDIGGTNIRTGIVALEREQAPDFSKARVWKFELWRHGEEVAPDGSISNGAQNRPGNWEGSDFNLSAKLHEAIPKIGAAETVIAMHNDAVVQGLSELPRMRDAATWAAFTVGTGLGNALFTNRAG
jgi:predicted NBD/HSP70 family sugar kinase